MSMLNYREMVTKNHLLYAFSDEIEARNEEINSYNFITKAKYKKQAKILAVVTI